MTKQISPLRQRMIDDMTIRNMSPNTRKIYTYAVANFSAFHGRSAPFALPYIDNHACADRASFTATHMGRRSMLAIF